MKRFAAGLAVGLLLGAAVPAIGQWSYVGVYKAKTLADAPAYVSVYGAGVYDAMVAQQYHLRGGGGGQGHLDRAFTCLRGRVYGEGFSKWARSVLAADPNRYAGFLIVDHACDGVKS